MLIYKKKIKEKIKKERKKDHIIDGLTGHNKDHGCYHSHKSCHSEDVSILYEGNCFTFQGMKMSF
jgi:hypothetical protein